MLVHVVLCSVFHGRMGWWSHFHSILLVEEQIGYGQIWKWPYFSLELSNSSSSGECLGSSCTGWGELSLSSWHLQKPPRAAWGPPHFAWLTLCSPALSCPLPSPRCKSVCWSCFPQLAASVGHVPSKAGGWFECLPHGRGWNLFSPHSLPSEQRISSASPFLHPQPASVNLQWKVLEIKPGDGGSCRDPVIERLL